MEVHHHAGDHHGPKKFKDYFLEFLMIFLAVTMGFLAENFREFISDKNHVAELAGQLKEDLRHDTASVGKLIEFELIQIRRTDSLYQMLIQPASKIDYKKLQDMIVSCDRMDFFYPSTGAVSTIKRESFLKKFVKTNIASYIDNYEKVVTVLQTFEKRDVDYLGKYIESFLSNHFTPENAAVAVLRYHVVNSSMRNVSQADLIQLSVDINLIKAYDLQLVKLYTLVKTDATAFIQHVSETYE
jgi:hypothetical protein